MFSRPTHRNQKGKFRNATRENDSNSMSMDTAMFDTNSSSSSSFSVATPVFQFPAEPQNSQDYETAILAWVLASVRSETLTTAWGMAFPEIVVCLRHRRIEFAFRATQKAKETAAHSDATDKDLQTRCGICVSSNSLLEMHQVSSSYASRDAAIAKMNECLKETEFSSATVSSEHVLAIRMNAAHYALVREQNSSRALLSRDDGNECIAFDRYRASCWQASVALRRLAGQDDAPDIPSDLVLEFDCFRNATNERYQAMPRVTLQSSHTNNGGRLQTYCHVHRCLANELMIYNPRRYFKACGLCVDPRTKSTRRTRREHMPTASSSSSSSSDFHYALSPSVNVSFLTPSSSSSSSNSTPTHLSTMSDNRPSIKPLSISLHSTAISKD